MIAELCGAVAFDCNEANVQGLKRADTLLYRNEAHGVMRASPVGHRTPGSTSSTSRHAKYRSRPAALWIAPSTPPPPSMRSLAATEIHQVSGLAAGVEANARGVGVWTQDKGGCG